MARIEGMESLRERLDRISSGHGSNRTALMRTVGRAVEGRAKEHTERFRKTGKLGRSIHVGAVTAESVRVEVGADYGPDVEYGTRPHEIRARRARALRWARDPSGRRLDGSPRRGVAVLFARKVQHPGTRAQPYLRPAAREVLEEGGVGDVIVALWNGDPVG